MTAHRRALVTAALIAGLLSLVVSALGIPIHAADVGAAAVDEPQYLLTAASVWEDGDLDIANQRAQGSARAYYDGPLPVQTSVLPGGERISPHDPLLPVLLAPAVGLGGYVGAKALMAVMAGLLGAATVWVLGTRWAVSPVLAGSVAAVAGMSAPLAIYGSQVYPELPAALAVVIAVGAIVPPRGHVETPRKSTWHAVVLVLAVTALPWLAIKYVFVAGALAAVGLWRLRTTPPSPSTTVSLSAPRLQLSVMSVFAISGAFWLAAHRVMYGGWTAYSTGDHFQGSGEFGAVGFGPDYLGRSVRMIGLLTDRDYGLIAWAPVWLLVIPAAGFLVGFRRPTTPTTVGRPHSTPCATATVSATVRLSLPLLAGWLTAVFVALTMHGFWSPGRQVVVVLPLAAMLIGVALSKVHARVSRAASTTALITTGALAAASLAAMGWVLVAGHQGTLTWIGAPNLTPPAYIAGLRSILPDYRELGTVTWVLHGLWVVAAILLSVGSWMFGRRISAIAPSTRDAGTHHTTATAPHLDPAAFSRTETKELTS